MTTLTNAIFTGYTEIDKPAQFKVAAKTRVIGGVEYVEFYDFYDVKNADDFACGVAYNIEITNGHAVEV